MGNKILVISGDLTKITSCTSCNNAIFVGHRPPLTERADFCVGGQCPPYTKEEDGARYQQGVGEG